MNLLIIFSENNVTSLRYHQTGALQIQIRQDVEIEYFIQKKFDRDIHGRMCIGIGKPKEQRFFDYHGE